MKSLPKVRGPIAVCLGIAAILSSDGCYLKEHSAYPIAWPHLVQTGDIEAQIEGIYYCMGETIGPHSEQCVEASLFGEYKAKSVQGCEYFTIRKINPYEIEISFMNHERGVIQKIPYNKGRDYQVDGNWVALNTTGSFGVDEILLGYESTTPHLATNSARDLIIRSEVKVKGTGMLIIPYAQSHTTWSRYTRKE